MKKIREVTSLDGDSFVIYYYLSASEIWPDKRGDLWWEEPYKSRTIVLYLDQDFKSEKTHFTVVYLVYIHLFLQY
jgi:hypothetical protein